MIVGLVGHKRVGKDTAAERLVQGYGFARVAFADPLKAIALELDPYLDTRHVEWRLSHEVHEFGWEAAKETPEVRRTLQALGVAVRKHDPGFWVRMGMASAAKHADTVITDVRFPNEGLAVVEAGGLLVRVVRDTGLVDTHVSETALDGHTVDYTIVNDGTVLDLHNSVDAIMTGVLAGGAVIASDFWDVANA